MKVLCLICFGYGNSKQYKLSSLTCVPDLARLNYNVCMCPSCLHISGRVMTVLVSGGSFRQGILENLNEHHGHYVWLWMSRSLKFTFDVCLFLQKKMHRRSTVVCLLPEIRKFEREDEPCIHNTKLVFSLSLMWPVVHIRKPQK